MKALARCNASGLVRRDACVTVRRAAVVKVTVGRRAGGNAVSAEGDGRRTWRSLVHARPRVAAQDLVAGLHAEQLRFVKMLVASSNVQVAIQPYTLSVATRVAPTAASRW